MRSVVLGLAMLGLARGMTAQSTETGTWRVRAAIVLNGVEVKAVPLHAFRLVRQPDSSVTISGRTGLDGVAEGVAPAGSYVVISDAPVRAGGVAYAWRVSLDVAKGRLVDLELTNLNATIDSTIVLDIAQSGRRLEDAVTTYRRLRRSVFRVEAGAGYGSGFLIDSVAGLVVTNAHVVANQTETTVVLDSATRVHASIVARSEQRDIAIVRIAPSVLGDRPPLELARPVPTASVVESGERVFAIGYPLDQEQTLTTGIVSSIRTGAIISDVNINPGNSGGPMLNYSGVVVGINTFGVSSGSGPGIAGAVVASEVWPVLEQARVAIQNAPPPPASLLPTMPLDAYQLDSIKRYADTVPDKRLGEYAGITFGPFELALQSPVTLYLTMQAYDREVARDRRRREERAGVDPSVRYSALKEIRDWGRFATSQLAPVVMIGVSPRIGETTGSVFGRILAGATTGAATRGTYKYRGDVSRVRFYRNGVEWPPIRGGTQPVEQYVDNQWVSLKDVANYGLYVVSPLLFAPDTNGTPPSIVVEVQDLKDQNALRCIELPRRTVAFTWNDFLPYIRKAYPDVRPRLADMWLPSKDFTASVIPGDSVVTSYPWRDGRRVWPSCSGLRELNGRD